MNECRHFLQLTQACSRARISCTCSFIGDQAICPYYSPIPVPDNTTSSAGDLGATVSAPQDSARHGTDAHPESLEKNVNHPKRYTKGKIECIDALESAVVGKTPEEAICVANVIKYLWRYEEKEPLRSLKSAEWYLKRLIAKYEIGNENNG